VVGDGFLDCGYSGLFAHTPLLCCSPLSIRLLCSVVGLSCWVVLFVGCRVFAAGRRFVFVGLHLCNFMILCCSEIGYGLQICSSMVDRFHKPERVWLF